ncbi:MAG: hypothetical protein LUE63_04625 [Lachnospiraceae bacterium]|nr:hypothetical protein [Lachnospiraceae bacterium]
MSKEKMDAYKAHKANRKQEIAKEKRRKKAAKAAWYTMGALCVAGICAAVGLTGWNSYKSYIDSLPDYSATELIVDDIVGILETEEETEEAEETASEDSESEETVAETAEENTASEETAAEDTESGETEEAE